MRISEILKNFCYDLFETFMQMNALKRDHANTKHVQVGRGGKRGKTAGRGTKGQNARSGHRKRPELRDIIKKIPKLRGHGKNRAKSAYVKNRPFAINLNLINAAFESGASVNVETLRQMKLINAAKTPAGVKILGNGDVTKKFNFSNVTVSESAKEKIVAAGGSVA